MRQQAVAGVERKCRSGACGHWTFFPIGSSAVVCPDCGARYGKVELGLDVTRFASRTVKVPKAPGQVEATKVAKPKPGEFGYRGSR